MTLKPETCPCCGKKDPVDILDDDGQKKFYGCDRCNITWMQNGFSGKPVLSSLQGGARNLYKSFLNAGCSESRARTQTYQRVNDGKIVDYKGEPWQRHRVYSTETDAKTHVASLKARGLVARIKSVFIRVGTGKKARRWVIYVNLRR